MRDHYTPPIDRMLLALRTAGLDGVLDAPPFQPLHEDAIRDVLEAFGRLAAEVIAPTNHVGDVQGAQFDRDLGCVVIPPPLAAAYEQFRRGGWISLAAPEQYGGGGFPGCVATCLQEMFGSANLALSLNPVLCHSAIEALRTYGDDRQRQLFLTRLISGEWTGTMNLTEPDAGSDVGLIRATATPLTGGRYAIDGRKMFITWGEHELTANIVHLVLARLPGAPAGTKGLTLFVVPKWLVADDGTLGERNRIDLVHLEHKLGIHASPTCLLSFDGAIGEMVGPPNGGMAAMFSMMNPTRLAIGVQGVSIGERAYQQAAAYARVRRQGRTPTATGREPCAIIEHPDVQRMLALIAVSVDACRLLTYATSVQLDLARHAADETRREQAQRRADLLTPLAKAWPTDLVNDMTSLAVQVHGGVGFIEETGVAQHVRDARIMSIYEGTNGIQAIDLVTRKLGRDHGLAMKELIHEMQEVLDRPFDNRLDSCASVMRHAVENLADATDWMVSSLMNSTADALAGATAYLELAATVVAGGLLLRQTQLLVDAGGEVARDLARLQVFASVHLQRVMSPAAITVGAGTIAAAC